MQHIARYCWSLFAATALVAGVLGWPTTLGAAGAAGQAQAVRSIIVSQGTSPTVLADTGTLGGSTDAREASQSTGSISSFVSGEALHATTIGFPDHVESEASTANVAVDIGGTTLTADFVMSRVVALQGNDDGSTDIRGLIINGTPISVSGSRNQRIDIPGGMVLLNEQQKSGGRLTVNALHLILNNVADVVVASSAAAQ